MTRVLSGVALAALALAAILFLPQPVLRAIVCLVAALATYEFIHIVDPNGPAPSPVEGRAQSALPLLALVMLTCWWMSDPGRGYLFTLLLLGLAWTAIEVLFRGLAVGPAAARFLALWYIGMPLGMLAAVQTMGGRMATLLLIATVVVSDSAQFYTGRLLGVRPLAPTISPKKTIEGAIGGVVLATLFIVLVGPWVFPQARRLSLALLGVAIVSFGICGDLFESRLKRIAGVKDSSQLIPGHGGVLDRIDALLFATPAFYLYVQA